MVMEKQKKWIQPDGVDVSECINLILTKTLKTHTTHNPDEPTGRTDILQKLLAAEVATLVHTGGVASMSYTELSDFATRALHASDETLVVENGKLVSSGISDSDMDWLLNVRS